MQFPAEAFTIHKSQGATYSKVVVHTSPGMQRAALYVACSRAISPAGFVLLELSSLQDPPKTRHQKESSENRVPLSY